MNVLSNSARTLRLMHVFSNLKAALPARPRVCRVAAGVALLTLAGSHAAFAQTAEAREPLLAASSPNAFPFASTSSSAEGSAAADSTLPDAPGYSTPASGFAGGAGGGQPRGSAAASRFDKVIEPGQTAVKLRVGDKILLGIRENATVSSAAGWVISAGYEQIVNSSPNYGQTGKGFAQRLGAAAARSSSENIFSDSVIAPILHEDPRYYKMGPGHDFFKRLFYSGTRGLITRTDGGHQTINFANIGGDLGGAALTQWYYPPINRNFTQVMSTWGSSIGGDAVGYVVDEFLSGALTTVHLKKKD